MLMPLLGKECSWRRKMEQHSAQPFTTGMKKNVSNVKIHNISTMIQWHAKTVLTGWFSISTCMCVQSKNQKESIIPILNNLNLRINFMEVSQSAKSMAQTKSSKSNILKVNTVQMKLPSLMVFRAWSALNTRNTSTCDTNYAKYAYSKKPFTWNLTTVWMGRANRFGGNPLPSWCTHIFSDKRNLEMIWCFRDKLSSNYNLSG